VILACILVQIVYIFARKIGFTRSKVSISLEEAIRIIQSQESGTAGLASDEESDLD